MSTQKEIGKIRSIKVGFGGYQDAMFGVSIELGSDKNGWGTGDFKGMWSSDPDKYCKWTKKDQDESFAAAMRFMLKLCKDAGVQSVNALVGKPVEVTFENEHLKGWRILKEVL